jgi:hypothetical protein
MSQITINTINGTPPYSIYVCSSFILNCTLVASGVTSFPYSFSSPSAFTYSPSVILKVIDSQSCEFIQPYNCLSHTPTPSFTVTPSFTPSNTSTPPVTPSNTQTSYTPTPTPTVTTTTSVTPTPEPTPPVGTGPFSYFLVIEPLSASTIIGNYMQSQGVNFFGFSNGVAPSTNQVDFENEINVYLNYSGWTSGELPSFITLQYPNVPYPIGNDIYGNPLSSYNFITTIISANTINGPAWYTFFLNTGATNGQYQKSIGVSTNYQNFFTTVNTNNTYYNILFEYKNANIYYPYVRMYTSFPSTEFLLDDSQNIYFKGSVIGT